MNILAIISIISGLYLIFLAFLMKTNNISSAFLFKLMPFILGCGSIFVGLTLLKIITLNI